MKKKTIIFISLLAIFCFGNAQATWEKLEKYHSTTAKDGTVFFKKSKINKEEFLVKIIDGKEEVIRDLAKEKIVLFDMKAQNKNTLWSVLKKTNGISNISIYVEKWNGSVWEQVGNNLLVETVKIIFGYDENIYLLVKDYNGEKNILTLRGNEWTKINIPFNKEQKISNFSVINFDNIWLVTDKGEVGHWNGKKLSIKKDILAPDAKIEAIPGFITLITKEGQIYRWASDVIKKPKMKYGINLVSEKRKRDREMRIKKSKQK
ncbi:hypothetical protein KAH94_02165 [bacterium]|nr:hypothetical protein [bacterium]